MTLKTIKVSENESKLANLVSDYSSIQDAVNDARRMNYTPRSGKAFDIDTFRFGGIINLVYRGQEVRSTSLRIISFFGKKGEHRYGIEVVKDLH